MKVTKINYEREACSRCGGSGRYSYCAMYGDMCFGCSGKGKQLSRAGERARAALQAFYTEHYTRPATELTPGDFMKFEGHQQYRKIKSIKPYAADADYMELTFCKGAAYTCLRDCIVIVRPTSEQFQNELVPRMKRFNGVTFEYEESTNE